MAIQSDTRTHPSGTSVAAVPPSFLASLKIPPAVFYYLLAALCVILILYPVGILLLASVFKGQPRMLGDFTLSGYSSCRRL